MNKSERQSVMDDEFKNAIIYNYLEYGPLTGRRSCQVCPSDGTQCGACLYCGVFWGSFGATSVRCLFLLCSKALLIGPNAGF